MATRANASCLCAIAQATCGAHACWCVVSACQNDYLVKTIQMAQELHGALQVFRAVGPWVLVRTTTVLMYVYIEQCGKTLLMHFMLFVLLHRGCLPGQRLWCMQYSKAQTP